MAFSIGEKSGRLQPDWSASEFPLAGSDYYLPGEFIKLYSGYGAF